MFATAQPVFWGAGRVARDLAEVTSDPAALDSGGFWAVLVSFEGEITCARFRTVGAAPAARVPTPWRGPPREAWASSMDRAAYVAAVAEIRRHIAAGGVYQANLCRVLSAPLPDPSTDLAGLAAALQVGNPAPHAAYLRLPTRGIEVVSASPELYLSRAGDLIESGPIKGTGRCPGDLQEKDRAENVMIVDLVRNDLGRVCQPGSVTVPGLCEVQAHPGLVHLVSRVRGRLVPGAGWGEVLAATFPPGSVSGAPKLAALDLIAALEPVPRGPYCGAIGWIDADRGIASLGVGIRTFWRDQDTLRFGTGAGITWGSDPGREWAETTLKADRLLGLAAGQLAPQPRRLVGGLT